MSTLGKAIKHFGLSGLAIYYRMKTGRLNQVNMPGKNKRIHLRNFTDDTKLFKQLLIHREYEFPSPIIPEFIIDAGANIGLSSVFFSEKFPKATILAVEAQEDNFKLLQKNTSSYPNIKCLNAGLWCKSTSLTVSNPTADTTGFMVSETTPDDPNCFKALSVDDILKTYNQSFIDLFKIDIEGAEREVLAQNNVWLSRTKILILELHDRKKSGCSQAFFKAFQDRNFECHPFGQNFLLINNDLI